MIKTRLAKAAAVLCAAASVTVMAPAQQAHAGDSCTAVIYCSGTFNNDNLGVTALKNWGSCGGTTGYETTNSSCVSGPTYWVGPLKHTPELEDWDVLQIDGGWCYKVQLQVPYKIWTLRYDRRGKGPSWVKIENHGRATVMDQSTSSCP